jgi:hypothetical protein
MPSVRIPLFFGLFSGLIALLCAYAGAENGPAAAQHPSGCVVCHTDRDMLTSTRSSTETKISALIEGPG